VLTVPFEGQAALLKQLKPAMTPRQHSDRRHGAARRQRRRTRLAHLGVWQGSAAQQAAELVPKGVSVVAAFHNVSAESAERTTLRSIAT
jgi:8-hydroxy-5-deazaflavin:NADPH oxidoreductase